MRALVGCWGNLVKTIIWAACFLPPDDQIYAAFSTIADGLLKHDIRLIVFSNTDLQNRGYSFLSIRVPFLITETGSQFSEFFNGRALPTASSILDEFIRTDAAWGGHLTGASAELSVLRGASFWEQAFHLLQPSAILTWGATAPLARMWFHLARRFQRPLFVLERGAFENTLNLSTVGQGALTEYTVALSMTTPDREDETLGARWEAISAYYSTLNVRHYQETNRSPSAGDIERILALPAPRILYLGSHDVGSGALFGWREFGDVQAPWIKTSAEGMDAVVGALSNLEGFSGSVMYKPHRGADFIYSRDAGFPVTPLRGLDVYKLIKSADVVVSTTTSSVFVALLAGKPAITLANTPFIGRGITWEPRSADELTDALRQALAGEGWPERLARGRSLLAAAFRDILVGTKDDVPTRHHLPDLIEMLGRFRYYTPNEVASADERIADFIAFREKATGDASCVERAHRCSAYVSLEEERRQAVLLRDEARRSLFRMTSLFARSGKESSELLEHLHQARQENAVLSEGLENLGQATQAILHRITDLAGDDTPPLDSSPTTLESQGNAAASVGTIDTLVDQLISRHRDMLAGAGDDQGLQGDATIPVASLGEFERDLLHLQTSVHELAAEERAAAASVNIASLRQELTELLGNIDLLLAPLTPDAIEENDRQISLTGAAFGIDPADLALVAGSDLLDASW